MRDRNVFSRGDVLRANDALRKTLSEQGTARSDKKSGNVRLSSSEINKAFAAAKKVLASA